MNDKFEEISQNDHSFLIKRISPEEYRIEFGIHILVISLDKSCPSQLSFSMATPIYFEQISDH